MSKRVFCRLMAGLYAAGALLLLALRLTAWFGLRSCEARELPPAAAHKESLLEGRTWYSFGPGTLLSSDGDPQLIWQIDGPVSGLRMTIRSSKPVVDPQLYYTTAPGQPYSLRRRLEVACSDPAAGVYEFWLPRAAKVYSLRLDPTSAGGAMMEIEVLLNPPVTARRLLPSLTALLALLAGPPLLVLGLQALLQALGRGKGPEKGDFPRGA